MTNMKPSILITGGNGFIGRALTEKLLHEGYNVRILTRRKPAVQPANPSVSLVQADYHKVESLQEAMLGCEGIFNLAGTIFGTCYKDFEEGNVLAVQNIVIAANKTHTVKTFVHVSSLAASGYAKKIRRPRIEQDSPLPVSDYGRTKLLGEKAVRQLSQRIKRTVIRPPIVYGKNDSGVSKIAAWVKRGLMVNTSGNGYFSFVYIEDLVNALYQAYVRPDTNRQTYFVAEPDIYTWDYFITQMAKAMHARKPFMPKVPVRMMRLAAWIYEKIAKLTGTQPALNYDKVAEAVIPGHWICSSEKWRTLTGQQFTPLEKGLEQSF
ncbi:MAG: NAD-dependent epimerase/dehydratase family protein [Elusimicrobiaceae bacterium]|nr:NAD-dependent epimerase/dehydratase family protein [Elusimicrobiaceae bacterium]